MMLTLAAGLLLGTAAPPIDPLGEHHVRVEHPAGPVEARYRPRIEIEHRQIGSVAPPGAAATLRCAWRADLHVAREARHASGSVLQAEMRREAVAQGSRRGWCAANRAAIAEEVASRTATLRDHVTEVAREDHGALTQALDRLRHGSSK